MSESVLRKILYVEDDADLQQVVSMILEDIGGYEVKICNSGKQALAETYKFQPDLFLLDVMLPEMDGPTLLKELRKNSTFKDIPAIFISAKVQGDELLEYSEYGVLGIIRKPFDPISISDTINMLYENYKNDEKQESLIRN